MAKSIGCSCAEACDEHHGWRCTITGDACMYLIPNSRQCAKDYGEGPDADEIIDGDEIE